MTAMGKVPK